MAEKESPKDLWLRVATTNGVVFEKYVSFVKVKKKDGLMIINRNYSPSLEQLADGEIVVNEGSKHTVIEAIDSWLTVSNNKCNIYSSKATVIVS